MTEQEYEQLKRRGIGNVEIVHLVGERKPLTLKLKSYIPAESAVQASIVDMIVKLRLGIVIRYNAGGMYNAENQFVRFNSAKGHSGLGGVLKGGRAFYLEVKRPGWDGPKTEREFQQAEFLKQAREVGAVAEFVCSVDEALAVLRQGTA
jgi:hypothetical protein